MNLVKLDYNSDQLLINLRYQSFDNVFGDVLYSEDFEAKLHPDAFICFEKAMQIAKAENLMFKVWDAYRPFNIQQMMFELLGESPYISDPATGSIPHCRGVAIDLTLCDMEGLELDMGTDFDNFTELAHYDSKGISENARNHRILLREIMTLAGFDSYDKEWWHFQLFKPRGFPVIED